MKNKYKYLLTALMCDLISITFNIIWLINNVHNIGTMAISFIPILFAIYFLYLSVTYKEPEKPKDKALIYTATNNGQYCGTIFPFDKISYVRLEQNENTSAIKIHTIDGEQVTNVFHNEYHVQDTTMLFDILRNHFNEEKK